MDGHHGGLDVRVKAVEQALLGADHPAGRARALDPVEQRRRVAGIEGRAVEQLAVGAVGVLPVVGQVAVKGDAIEQVLRGDLEF